MNPKQYQTRKIVIVTTLVLFGCLVVWLSFWAFTHGRLSISAPGKIVSVEVYNQSSGEQVFNATSSGKPINKTLSNGKYEVRLFSEGGQSSVYFINIPRWLGKKSVAAELLNQHGRSKLARNTERCLLYSRDKLYSHGCYGSSELFMHTPTKFAEFSRRENTPIGSTLSIKHYKEDLIALFISEQDEGDNVKIAPSLALIRNGRIVKTINLPSDFYSENTDYTLVVDRMSAKIAVGKDSNTDILVFNELGPEPGRFKPNIETTINIDLLESTLDFYDGKLYLFIGKPSGSPDSAEEATELTQNQDTIISVFDSVSLKKDYDIKTSVPNDLAAKCAPTVICFLNDNSQLTLLNIESGLISPLFKINDVSGYDYDSDGTLYYIQHNSVNALDINNQVSSLVFRSDKFSPFSIVNSKSGLLINTFIVGDENNKAHAFLLDNEPGDDDFIDNHLPYERGRFGVVQDSDFSDSILLVKLALTSWEADVEGSTNFRYDVDEFNTSRNIIKKHFEKNSINKKIKLVVIP
jgi:hypothetical protein